MSTFICQQCGYVSFNEAPERCPVCLAPKEKFKADDAIIKKPADPKNLNELEKKHIPVIDIKRQCGLVGPGCVDAHIKVGEIIHVMELKHYIMYIDLYLDYNYIGRHYLVPEKVNPVIGIHLKVAQGKLTALENCNIHGRWVGEAEL